MHGNWNAFVMPTTFNDNTTIVATLVTVSLCRNASLKKWILFMSRKENKFGMSTTILQTYVMKSFTAKPQPYLP